MRPEHLLETEEELERVLQETVRLEKVDEMVRLWLIRLAAESKGEDGDLRDVEDGLSELMGETSRHADRLIDLMEGAGLDFDYRTLYEDSLYRGVSEVSEDGIRIDLKAALKEQREHELEAADIYCDLAEALVESELGLDTSGMEEELESMCREEKRHAELVRDLAERPEVGAVSPWLAERRD